MPPASAAQPAGTAVVPAGSTVKATGLPSAAPVAVTPEDDPQLRGVLAGDQRHAVEGDVGAAVGAERGRRRR